MSRFVEIDDVVAAPPSFEDGVSAILMSTEELRRSLVSQTTPTDAVVVDQERVLQWRDDLEDILHQMTTLHRLTLDAIPDNYNNDQVQPDLYRHCHQRAAQIVSDTFQKITSRPQDSRDVIDFELDGQAAIARIVETYVILQQHLQLQAPEQQQKQPNRSDQDMSSSVDSMISAYVSYQRQILRQRSKPALAHLADLRKRKAQQHQYARQRGSQQILVEEDHEETGQRVGEQPHARAMTAILGAAIALIHPLSQWKDHLPPPNGMISPLYKLCDETIRVLHDQAESLTKTVSDWFWEDRNVDKDWMNKTAMEQQHDDYHYGERVDLAELDALVDEMAFGCQVLARYQALIAHEIDDTIIEKEVLPVWTWKYAALERYLASQHWQSALEQASPVTIVMGTSIHVPSVVEDAQYLSTRALERAASTQCLQAMGTVAHSISSDIWSSESDGGVYSALVHERGCWKDEFTIVAPPAQENRPNVNSGNGFASALLSALDQDLSSSNPPNNHNNNGGKATITKKPSSGHSSAPSSGGFLGLGTLTSSLGAGGEKALQRRLTIQLCALNGIHSAITACGGLVQLIDSLLSSDEDEDDEVEYEQSAISMIQLAREDLVQFEDTYRRLLTDKVQTVIEDWCGSAIIGIATRNPLCIERLQEFFEQESYDLESSQFAKLESDERLQEELVGPLKESRLLQQLDKCDAEVVLKLCESICGLLSGIITRSLFEQRKRVNDWGALLLSKEVRVLRNYMSQIPTVLAAAEQFPREAAALQKTWERISQIVTVLQLERPSDWFAYQGTSMLDKTDLQTALELRVDFSQEAISSVLASIASSNNKSKA